jgi:hypothetical protein
LPPVPLVAVPPAEVTLEPALPPVLPAEVVPPLAPVPLDAVPPTEVTLEPALPPALAADLPPLAPVLPPVLAVDVPPVLRAAVPPVPVIPPSPSCLLEEGCELHAITDSASQRLEIGTDSLIVTTKLRGNIRALHASYLGLM